MLQDFVHAHIIQTFPDVRFESTLVPAHALGLINKLKTFAYAHRVCA